MMLPPTLSLAAVLLGGSALPRNDFKSGPQIGEQSSRFSALFLNGDQADNKRCPV